MGVVFVVFWAFSFFLTVSKPSKRDGHVSPQSSSLIISVCEHLWCNRSVIPRNSLIITFACDSATSAHSIAWVGEFRLSWVLILVRRYYCWAHQTGNLAQDTETEREKKKGTHGSHAAAQEGGVLVGLGHVRPGHASAWRLCQEQPETS